MTNSAKTARRFIIRYLQKSHESIIDPLVAALDLEMAHKPYAANVSYRNFHSVLIERTIWEDHKHEIRSSIDSQIMYAQIVDRIWEEGEAILKNRQSF